MRVAFIADIHGNGVALDAVLEDIEKRKVDRIAVLGDIAFRGPEPKRVLERVRSLPADVIKGNADEWTARGGAARGGAGGGKGDDEPGARVDGRAAGRRRFPIPARPSRKP
ncbi:metallophosphoesterase family protein [Planifilum fimeticola]